MHIHIENYSMYCMRIISAASEDERSTYKKKTQRFI